jgi:hypothetical protein
LVICNAAITHPSLSHDGRVKTHVGEGGGTAAAAWVLVTTIGESTYGGISSIFLLDLTSLLVANEQEYTSCNCRKSNESNDHTCRDSSLARTS